MKRCWIRIQVLLCLLSLVAAASHAEETRAGEINAAKKEKAKQLAPYKPGLAEKALRRAESALTALPAGPYAFLGSVYFGGLLALGPGYRRPYGEGGAFDVHGAWSLENYRLIDTTLRSPYFADGRLSAGFHGRYIHANKVPFYGLGNDSPESSKTTYEFRPAVFGVDLSCAILPRLTVTAGVDYLKADTTETRNPDVTADGAGTDPVYTVTVLRAAFDSRQNPNYTTRGGLYRVEFRDYAQHGQNGPLSFTSFEGEVNQFIPLFRANQVIALKALVTTSHAEPGSLAPFYLRPWLGGSALLRAYPTSRFVDNHRLLLAAEYRWTPSRFLDAALYAEAGKVASRKSDLNLQDLHSDFGFGLRFHSPQMTILRIEVAHGSEGTRFIFTSGPSF